MRYAQILDATWISPIWSKLAKSGRDDFRPTLEDACQATVGSLGLSPPVITHRVADMFREACFATRYYASLTVGAIASLLVSTTAAADKKLRENARL